MVFYAFHVFTELSFLEIKNFLSINDICTHSHMLNLNTYPMKDFSYITSSDPAFIESLYKDFTKDPNSVDPEFKKFFEGFDFAVSNGTNGKAATLTAPAAEG